MALTVQQVVILAGGLGTRLAQLTQNTSKPIIPVAGKPYLEWQIERQHGFSDFLLLTGYLSEKIEAHFGGVQLLTIGVVGEYADRIYGEIKCRPLLYLVRKTEGVEDFPRAGDR